MDYRFIYDDGVNNLVNESGHPVADLMDMDGLLPIETLTSLDEYREVQQNKVLQTTTSRKRKSWTKNAENFEKSEVIPERYHSYSDKEKEVFFERWTKRPGVSVASIARELGIHVRSAQMWVRAFHESTSETSSEDTIGERKTRSKKLNDEHKQCLYDFLDKNPSARLDEMMVQLERSFNTLSLSKSTVFRFVKDECAFTFKLARK